MPLTLAAALVGHAIAKEEKREKRMEVKERRDRERRRERWRETERWRG